VATISRLLKIVGLFCKISSILQGSFAKETYNFKEPTNRSRPISVNICIHIDIFIYIYIYVYWPHRCSLFSCMRPHIYVRVYKYINTYILTYMNTHIRIYIHTYIHTYVHKHIMLYPSLHAHARLSSFRTHQLRAQSIYSSSIKVRLGMVRNERANSVESNLQGISSNSLLWKRNKLSVVIRMWSWRGKPAARAQAWLQHADAKR